MNGEVFKGNAKDVVAELKAEGERSKGRTVGEWLRRRKKKLKADDKDQHKNGKKEG